MPRDGRGMNKIKIHGMKFRKDLFVSTIKNKKY